MWIKQLHSFPRRCCHNACTECLSRYRTRHFFNNSNTNEDIATKFEQEYVRCVRNEEECVSSAPNYCNILISGKIIKEMPGSVARGTHCSMTVRLCANICLANTVTTFTAISWNAFLYISCRELLSPRLQTPFIQPNISQTLSSFQPQIEPHNRPALSCPARLLAGPRG